MSRNLRADISKFYSQLICHWINIAYSQTAALHDYALQRTHFSIRQSVDKSSPTASIPKMATRINKLRPYYLYGVVMVGQPRARLTFRTRSAAACGLYSHLHILVGYKLNLSVGLSVSVGWMPRCCWWGSGSSGHLIVRIYAWSVVIINPFGSSAAGSFPSNGALSDSSGVCFGRI